MSGGSIINHEYTRQSPVSREITLIIAKRVTDRRSETLSDALCDTMGVDISMWVETTK
jgi:hypothetical protein